jgi:hypothetical protein
VKINKIVATLSFLVLVNSTANAKIETLGHKVMEYGVPCAAALGVSFILAKEEKFAIAMAACAATSAVTYYHRQDRDDMKERMNSMNEKVVQEIKKEIIGESKKQMVSELKKEVYAEVNQSLLKDKEFISKMLSELKGEFTEYKNIIDQVLAIKLAEFQGQIPKEIESALINGPFLKLLEEKLVATLTDKQKDIFKENKDALVKQCVSEALDQIVIKQIGIRESGLEIEN